MFLRNWYKGIAACMRGDANDTFQNLLGNATKLVTNGSFLGYMVNSNSTSSICPTMAYTRQSLTNVYPGVIFGTGNEPPTVDDYKLSGEIVTGFDCSISLIKTYDDSGTKIEGLYTITNASADPITIGEVAMLVALGNSTAQSYAGLVERTALETPITIEPGGVGQVTYTIEFKYPTA